MSDDVLDVEIQRCLDALSYVLKYKGRQDTQVLINAVLERCQNAGVPLDFDLNTPYVNTISVENQPEYPGNLEIEERITNIMRWNAMSMVVKANRLHDGLGGHISSFASSAVLYEVGFNHFFRGGDETGSADQIFFQGHASPGIYARAYLEGRLKAKHLHHFRQELAEKGGLSSYPHPYLMPDFWQYPTVSMGLGPILSIYSARFNRYMQARGFLKHDPKVWCFIGDGETDEPETLGALTLAAREKLDNLIFVINCNLQRLDGPVRGNGKIIQELEGVFKGAGWNVIKVIWGSGWDELLANDKTGLLIKRMNECVDGEYQKFKGDSGSYLRKHFFGKYPELLDLVNHMTDDQLIQLHRGGHDFKKVYAAYHAAVNTQGQPTVILAKTVKGYGLGEAGEGKNITHQQKKMNEKELREFRKRFDIPLDEDEVVSTPFFNLPESSVEMKYLHKRREEMGGYLPSRQNVAKLLSLPESSVYDEFLTGTGDSEISTTMAFVRILSKLLKDPEIGRRIVPIIPDEARTFGMEALFRQIGIYAFQGQLYEPVDKDSLLYYREEKDGQILEEGINEAGSMSSFISAGTAYANHGEYMIPFFIYYSMFGFQRVGDLMWLAGDIRARGFLLGGTAGRTTLNGEGLQHQDGHSHLMAGTIPSFVSYDPAFRFEIAVIIEHGMKRMYQDNEDVVFYLTLGNENYQMPEMPKGAKEGIIRGMYKLKSGLKRSHKAHILGSGSLINEALKAQQILAKSYNVSADVWSVTSYSNLRREAQEVQRYNLLHPSAKPKKSYLETVLAKENGVFVAVSDNMKLVSDQIHPWIPGGLLSLGTDGFGRSDTREKLRDFFEVDARYIVLAVLYQLAQSGELSIKIVQKAVKELKIDSNKVFPEIRFY